jgi:hypothetical protein
MLLSSFDRGRKWAASAAAAQSNACIERTQHRRHFDASADVADILNTMLHAPKHDIPQPPITRPIHSTATSWTHLQTPKKKNHEHSAGVAEIYVPKLLLLKKNILTAPRLSSQFIFHMLSILPERTVCR